MFNVNNVSYFPPGLGRVTTGHSMQIVMQRDNAVSYTHLDVYKRQALEHQLNDMDLTNF